MKTFNLLVQSGALALLFCLGSAASLAADPPEIRLAVQEEKSLFDGRTLQGWQVTDFAGHGEVRVEGGKILLGMGAALTGMTWAKTNEIPRVNYEVELEAMKVDGSDFFCGLTFPVKASHGSFIVGGWGGGVVGISSIDGMDASENETTQYREFKQNQWYRIRVRVTAEKIEAWIDADKMVDQIITGRRISLRAGEIESSIPFGVASWQTTAALRDIRLRPLGAAREKKVVLIAGAKSHGPGDHEYERGMKLLKQCLDTAPNVPGLKTEVHLAGWPADPKALEDADTVMLYCDGADHNEQDHPLLRGNRLETLGRQMKRGCGFIAIHYAVFVPSQKTGPQFLDWLGGYFDYENGPAANKWFSKIETKEFALKPATPGHAIARGLQPFALREEFYFNLRFAEKDKRWTAILAFGEDKSDPTAVVAWAVERSDGGRGFGYTGGHFHKNWENENVRKMLLNAILWTAGAEVPAEGVKSSIADQTERSTVPPK